MAKRTKKSAAIPTLPAYRECTYRELIKEIYPEVKDFMASTFTDWSGNGVYKNAAEFIADFEKGEGSLQKVADMYTAEDFTLASADAYTPSFEHDVWGTDLDFAAYMNGEPECFINILPAERVKTNLTIRIQHAVHAGIEAKKATQMYLRIADLYTAALAKHNVRIIFEWAGKTGGGKLYKWEVNVCDYSEVLSPQMLVSALSGPMYRAWLRVITKGVDGFDSDGAQFHPDNMRAWDNEFMHRAAIRKGDEVHIGIMLHGWGCDINKTFSIESLMQSINEGAV